MEIETKGNIELFYYESVCYFLSKPLFFFNKKINTNSIVIKLKKLK